MKLKTALNHKSRLLSQVNSIYSGAKCYHSTHEEILTRMSDVWKDEGLKRCPGWVSDAISQASQHLLHDIQMNWLVWLFKTPRGIMSYDFLTDDERKEINSQTSPGNHYWLKSITPHVGTVANPGNYKVGDIVTRQFEVTDKQF